MFGLYGCNTFFPRYVISGTIFGKKYVKTVPRRRLSVTWIHTFPAVIIWQHVSENLDRPQAFNKIYERGYGMALIALVITFLVHVACHVVL
jgi:hypothetical protein